MYLRDLKFWGERGDVSLDGFFGGDKYITSIRRGLCGGGKQEEITWELLVFSTVILMILVFSSLKSRIHQASSEHSLKLKHNCASL